MNNNAITKKLDQVRRKLMVYKQQWPTKAGGVAMRFIDSNFTAQGWQGNTLTPWQKTKSGKRNVFGTKPAKAAILVGRGRLRASWRLKPLTQKFKIYSISKYAKAHNEGFKGAVAIPEHTRKIKQKGSIGGYTYGSRSSVKTKKKLKAITPKHFVKVKAHTRNMNLPMRQMAPNSKRGSTILHNQLYQFTHKDIARILTIKH